MTVVTDRMPGLRSATLGFFYRVGSRHEPLELAGISHFIEHCVFKGTERRTAKEIAIEQDRLGGNLDAFTTHEETGFAIKVTDDAVSAAFDLLADMLSQPRFDDADLLTEQRVIIEEMKMIEDSPEEYLGDLFAEAFFPDHPLGRNIAGSPATVRSFDTEKTRSYHASVFDPSNLIIAAAGNIDHGEIVDLASKYFGFASNSTPRRPEPPTLAAPIFVTQKQDLEQAHMVLAIPMVAATDSRRYAADLLANMIGGGTSSRLWQKVREDNGLAYSVGASYSAYQDCGMMSVFAATSPEHVEDVLDIVLDEMRWIVREGITREELILAKQQTHASILLGLEDSASRAAALAQSELVHGRQIPVEETIAAIDRVSESDIHAIATEFFRSDLTSFAAIGDLADLNIDRERLSL